MHIFEKKTRKYLVDSEKVSTFASQFRNNALESKNNTEKLAKNSETNWGMV